MRRRLGAFVLASLAACAGPRFLGAPIGHHCDDHLACRAWASAQVDRSLLTEYDDPGLRAYVAGVLGRVVRASHLPAAPPVMIVNHGSSAMAMPDGTIQVSRGLLAALDSEAELAAVLAHELAHVDARTATLFEDPREDPAWRQWKRDTEAVADERAVGWLIAAGYDPAAMVTMLRAVARGVTHDDDHPTLVARIALVSTIAGTRAGGELGRARYQRRVEGLVLGDDPRIATVIDEVAVSLAIGVAIRPLNGEALRASFVRTARGDDLVARLTARRVRRVAGHEVVTGVMPADPLRDDPSRASLRDQALAIEHARATGPGPRARVLVLRGAGIDLWVAVDGRRADERLTALLAGIRAPSEAERRRVQVPRLRYRAARSAATYATAVAQSCAAGVATTREDPLDDPARVVRAGELIKCVGP